MVRTILVTGSCGTTGSDLVKYLLDNTDDYIIGVDNFYKEGSRSNLRELKSYDGPERFYFLEGDITEKPLLDELGSYNIAQVYNLAAIVETPEFYENPYGTYRVNCQGSIDLYRWCQRSSIPKYLNASSSEIYGRQDLLGDDSFPIKESNPDYYGSPETTTRWSYAHGKVLTEYVINHLYRMNGITEVCHLRYANVYGENDLSPVHVIPYILDCIINEKELVVSKDYETVRRTFLHEDDSSLGTFLAMERMTSERAYNLGSNEEVTIKELIELCNEVCQDRTGRKFTPRITPSMSRTDDPTRRVLDTRRASEELGFYAKVGLREGITRMVDKLVDKD